MWARRPGDRFPARTRDFCLLRKRTSALGLAESCVWLVPEVKRSGCALDHPNPCNSEVKNEWSPTSPPLCLHGVHGDSAY